jgi:hypothetical protein
LLAIFWLVWSVFHLFGAGVLLIVANTIFSPSMLPDEIPPAVPGLLQPLLTLIGGFMLVQALAGIAAGWGLLERQSWARLLALVLGFLCLLSFPLGTALGCYTLWVLLSRQAQDEYQRLARPS